MSATTTQLSSSLAPAACDTTGEGIVPSAGACCPRPLPLLRLAIGIFVAAQTMSLGLTINISPPENPTHRMLFHVGMLAATAIVVALLGWPLAVEAARQVLRRRVTMELLFLAGIGSAMGISVRSTILDHGPVYYEVVCVLLVIYCVGHAISARSRQRAMAAIEAMTAPIATVRRVRGSVEEIVPVGAIVFGDIVRVLPGELIPVDGRIVEGTSLVRQTPFTGEWTSVLRSVGQKVLAGTAAEDGAILVEATSAGNARQVDRLAALIDSARAAPTSLQRSADRFVRWFLPLVALLASGTFAFWLWRAGWDSAIYNALAVVLVACPCAAGLAAPLAMWQAMGRLAQDGLVLRGGDVLERLASADMVIFDKTGTLADQRLGLVDLRVVEDPALRGVTLAAMAAVERLSTHPVAKLLRSHLPSAPSPSPAQPSPLSPSPCTQGEGWGEGSSAAPVEPGDSPRHGSAGASPSPARPSPPPPSPAQPSPPITVTEMRTVPGRGVEALVHVAGQEHRLQLLRQGDDDAIPADLVSMLPHRIPSAGNLTILAFLDGRCTAAAEIAEMLRDSSARAVAKLGEMGLPVHIMTGDSPAGADKVRQLAQTTAGMSPQSKHQTITGLGERARPLYVGDGLNDAAAMAASHVSIALADGDQIAIDSASATLHHADMTLVPRAIALARRTVATIRGNLLWAVGYNFVGIVAAMAGLLHPVLAALLMSASSALVAYRSSHVLSERATRTTRPIRPKPAPAEEAGNPWLWTHMAGFVGQAVVLAYLADLSLPGASLLTAAIAVPGYVVSRMRLPAWADMTLGMVSIGGLGMNFGWLMDMSFAPAVQDGIAASCCATPVATHWLLTWMNIGMVVLGVPAMFMLRRTPQGFAWREWLRSGCLLIGTPGMIIGMHLGGLAAARWMLPWPSLHVIWDYALMMVGMVAGMLVPTIFSPLVGATRVNPPDRTAGRPTIR